MSSSPKVVFLSGGTGTPKILKGTAGIIDPENITIIGNTGDDWKFYGLYVSPDIDSILLTLSDLIDTEKWWGIKGDSFNLVKFLKNYLREDVWFNLGDRDAGLCLFRSMLLKQGFNLTQVTEMIKNRLAIPSQILPMSNYPVQTFVRTTDSTLHLQEFWVRYKGKPEVNNVFFEGDLTQTTIQVLKAIENANLIIIGPSNPISSIGPILSIIPIRKALKESSGFKIAISPLIGTNAISGPTANFMKAWGKQVSPLSIVDMYKDFLDGFIIDFSDEKMMKEIEQMGVNAYLEDIMIHDEDDAKRLIKKIVENV